jgi:ATP-dependent DNA helicase PIF1
MGTLLPRILVSMAKSPQIEVTTEFQNALQILEGTTQNLFLTGKAGTGKSTLLKYFRDRTKKSVVVLAPTGVAALNVSGQTIHSFFGFKPSITVEDAKKTAKKTHKKELINKVDLIIVDEISMVRADLLDCMDVFLQVVLKNKNPFGGKQVVFIGDLYQLPPVVSSGEKLFFSEVYTSPYFFSAKVIKRSNFELKFIELDKIYRQTEGPFIGLLNAIRNNSITPEQLEHLNTRVHPEFNAPPGYIHLTGTNQDADQINSHQLNQLNRQLFTSEGKSTGEFNLKDSPTEPALKLKVGAQVMFLNNDSLGRWVNGTIGTIKLLPSQSVKITSSEGDYPELQVEIPNQGVVSVTPFKWAMFKYSYDTARKLMTQETLGSFTQYPLKLSWAITIHKSQGKTFDRVILDLKRGTFAHGQSYVALSRCRSFEGLILKYPFKKSHILMDFKVVKFLTQFQYKKSEEALSLEDKITIIKQAITSKNELEIIYLKANDEKSNRRIIPKKVATMSYLDKNFLGMEAFCQKRQENRVFRVDRILELRTV